MKQLDALDKEKLKKSAPIIVLFILLFLVGYWALFLRHYEKTDNAYVKSNTIIIRPKITGYISEVLVDENEEVKAGAIIARIEKRDYAAKLQKAESNILLAKNKIEEIKDQIELQKNNINQAKALLESSNASLKRADNEYVRANNLAKSGNTSQQRLDIATESYKAAQADFNIKNLALSSSEKQLHILESQLNEAHERLVIAEADLELAKIDMENTDIKAPFDGYIGKSIMKTGQLVQPGLALGYLVSKDDLWIEANFKEIQIKKMQPGQLAIVEIDAFKGQKFYGKIKSIAPATGSEFSLLPPENATGNFTKVVQRIPVKIVLDENSANLKSGMSAYVTVRTR